MFMSKEEVHRYDQMGDIFVSYLGLHLLFLRIVFNILGILHQFKFN